MSDAVVSESKFFANSRAVFVSKNHFL